MRPRRAGSLGRRLARWLALLTLVGLALTCLGIYTVTALSLKGRYADFHADKFRREPDLYLGVRIGW